MSLLYNGTPISKVSYNGSDLSSLTYNGNELIEDIDYTHFYMFSQKAEDTPEGTEIGYPASTTGVNGAYRWNGFAARGSSVVSGFSDAVTSGHEFHRVFSRAGTYRGDQSGSWALLRFPFEVEFRALTISNGSTGKWVPAKASVKLGNYSTIDSVYSSYTWNSGSGLYFTSGNRRGNTIRVDITNTSVLNSSNTQYMEIRSIVVYFYARRSDIVNWQNQYGLTFKQYEVT